MVRLASLLQAQENMIQASVKTNIPAGIYAARTLVQDGLEVSIRVINSTNHDQILAKGFPLACC
jgi:hypothetical protein